MRGAERVPTTCPIVNRGHSRGPTGPDTGGWMIRGTTRRATVLGTALMALILAAQPVAAAHVTSTTGHVGRYTIHDKETTTRGANCDYKTHLSNGQYLLKDISVRPPSVRARNTGPGNQSQWVGWQFKIDRDTNFDGVYANVFTSAVVKRVATETSSADFVRRTWTPASTPKGNFRVRIVIFWYTHASKTNETGRVKATLEWYHARKGGASIIRHNSCNQAFG